MLEIKNLKVEIEGKEILKGINLKLEDGKIHALMGPNGSGKSTLALALMNHPKYKITSGKIILNGKDITNLSPDEKAKKGLFLSFQNPQEIDGVTVYNFLRQALNSVSKEKVSIFEFRKLIEKKAEELGLEKEFLLRYVNAGFSGGEKKKSEILQMFVLDPSIAILDETDSGLDIDSLKTISEGIKKFTKKGKISLIITHYKRMLEYLKPDKIFIMSDGKIALEAKETPTEDDFHKLRSISAIAKIKKFNLIGRHKSPKFKK